MTTVEERVRQLMGTSGLTQHEFAEQIGLDASKMSKSLSGTRRFSSLDLARIAELTGETVDWILTGRGDEYALAARVSGSTTAVHAIAEARRIATAREDVASLGYAQPFRGVDPVKAVALDLAQGSKLAARALERVHSCGLSTTDSDLPTVVEKSFGTDVAITDLGDDIDGLAVVSDAVRLILASKSRLPWRQRFTVAHELAHVLMGDSQGGHVDVDIVDASHRKQPSERRANAFAAAFLMPEATLRGFVGNTRLTREQVATLATDLRVSPNALIYRLKNLALIDPMHAHKIDSMSAKSAAEIAGRATEFGLEAASASCGRPPGILTADTYQAYLDGKATLRPYANVLNLDPDVLRAQLEADQELNDQ